MRPSPFVWSMQKMALPQGLQKPCRGQLRGRVQLWRPEKYNLKAKYGIYICVVIWFYLVSSLRFTLSDCDSSGPGGFISHLRDKIKTFMGGQFKLKFSFWTKTQISFFFFQVPLICRQNWQTPPQCTHQKCRWN